MRTIILFTDKVSNPFVYNEIICFSDLVHEVIVVCNEQNLANISFPVNVSIRSIHAFNTPTKLDHIKAGLSNFWLILNTIKAEYTSEYSNREHKSRITQILKSFIKSCITADKIDKDILKLKKLDNSVFISFWFNEWATILGILKHKNKIRSFYSRAHGRDLFEYREPITKKLALREFQIKQVKEVYSVSKAGQYYLQDRYPTFESKFKNAYLGSYDHGKASLDNEAPFTIVSCANIRNIKRIHVLMEVLMHIPFNFKWVHFGKEPSSTSTEPADILYFKQKEKILNHKNSDVHIKGSCLNSDILNFYKSNSINLFISLSETEGVPVSMMEAASFGIPILSTDVGGCSEIILDKVTGILISKDFNVEEVADLIVQFSTSTMNTNSFHKQVRENWESNFSITKNYKSFLKAIIESN